MDIHTIQSRLKPFMMPLAILLGVLFHSYIDIVAWIVPYLIFVMLFFTFCRIEPRDLKFHKEMWQLLAIQILGSIIVFLPLNFINPTLARSALVCVLCPVATAAPVVTGMLGGSIGRVASFSVLSNLSVALCAPAIFALVSPDSQLSFLEEFATIALKVCPMIVFPLLAAFLIRILTPRVHASLTKAAPITFYIWSISLIIVVGRSVSFIMAEPRSYWPVMTAMALTAGILCAIMFAIGKSIGRRHGDAITAGQSLGQKNTIMAIWMATTYLDGITSVAPAAYVLWQNMFNSLQLYRRMKQEHCHNSNA